MVERGDSGRPNGTVIYNHGLWDAQSDENLNGADYNGNGVVFNNYGTFRKSGGAGEFNNATVFTYNAFFNQVAGVIDVQNGTNGLELALEGGGSYTGGYITTNQFGLTVLSGASININGAATGANTWQAGGNLVGTNVIRGALTWVAGVWNGASSVTIAPNTELIVAGGGGVNDMPNTVVTNDGTVTWSSGEIRGGKWHGHLQLRAVGYAERPELKRDRLQWQWRGVQQLWHASANREASASLTMPRYFTYSVVFNQIAGVLTCRTAPTAWNWRFKAAATSPAATSPPTARPDGISSGDFNINGTVVGTNTWRERRQPGRHQRHQRRFDLGRRQLEQRALCDHHHQLDCDHH